MFSGNMSSQCIGAGAQFAAVRTIKSSSFDVFCLNVFAHVTAPLGNVRTVSTAPKSVLPSTVHFFQHFTSNFSVEI